MLTLPQSGQQMGSNTMFLSPLNDRLLYSSKFFHQWQHI
jgi:hypothetical protein